MRECELRYAHPPCLHGLPCLLVFPKSLLVLPPHHHLRHPHRTIPKFRPVRQVELFILFTFSREAFLAVSRFRNLVENAVGVSDARKGESKRAQANLGCGRGVTSLNSPEKAVAKRIEWNVAGHLLQQ